MACPWCREVGRYQYHGTYQKYWVETPIDIIRVRCQCRHTHAIMPSFSVPWQSLGAAEVETWLHRRDAGASRLKASLGLSPQVDWYRTGRRLERSLDRLLPVIKAVLLVHADHRLGGFSLLATVAGSTEQVLYAVNRRCLAAGSVPLCFARTGDLAFARRNAGSRISHDLASAIPDKSSPDSS